MSPRAPAALRRAALAAALALAPACFSGGVRSIPDTHTRYDHLEPTELRHFEDARRNLDAGRPEEARSALAQLFEQQPDSIVLGVWLQEAELAVASSGAPSTARPEGTDALELLRRRYRSRAEQAPTATNYVLAARLEGDDEAARKLLDSAAELDARCAWVHYARAFLSAKHSGWEEIRKHLERARAADPGHMPTRWLEAWMLARAGRVEEARTSLDTWLDKAQGDLRLDGRLVLEARIDLALLLVLDGDGSGARKLLAEIEAEGRVPARSRMVEAAAEQALDEPELALEAAAVAEKLAPGELLPVVQQALLHELWLADPSAAEADWTRVLALSRNSPELSSMLERVRARVELERHQGRRETESARAGASPRPR